jgi:hypothetical protein
MNFEYGKFAQGEGDQLRPMLRGPEPQFQSMRVVDHARKLMLVCLGEELHSREVQPKTYFNLLWDGATVAFEADLQLKKIEGRYVVLVEVSKISAPAGLPVDEATLASTIQSAIAAFWSGLHRVAVEAQVVFTVPVARV